MKLKEIMVRLPTRLQSNPFGHYSPSLCSRFREKRGYQSKVFFDIVFHFMKADIKWKHRTSSTRTCPAFSVTQAIGGIEL